MERESLTEAVTRTLDCLAGDLERDVELARVNTVLALADRSLVLPSPAVALLEVESGESKVIGPRTAFRSLEPAAPDGEVWMTPAAFEGDVHPLIVRSVKSEGAPSDLGAGRLRLQVELVRHPGSALRPGWLTLHVAGSPWSHAGSRSARASLAGARTPVRFPSPRFLAGDASVAFDHVQSLYDGLVQVWLPEPAVELETLVVDLDVWAAVGTTPDPVPQVRANVVPVWNSVPARFPAFDDIDTWAAGHAPHGAFPLMAEPWRRSWRAWRADRVVVEGLRSTSIASRAVRERPDEPCWHAALIPSTDVSPAGRGAPVLTVVLDDAARRLVHDERARVHIDYCLTQGAAVNGLRGGLEFQGVELADPPQPASMRGRLLLGSYGGCDGLAAADVPGSGRDALCALMPSHVERSVGDVVEAVRQRFPTDLELVDPRDLVRRHVGAEARPLLLRLRCLRPDRPAWARRAVLSACSGFLERYLRHSATGGVQVVEAPRDMP